MERDPLNFFQPFENLPPNHENQLTRALLLVLRFSPMSHECWLGRLGTGKRLHELPPASFDTQRRAIPLEHGAEDPLPLVSVYLAPGPSWAEGTVVVASDRTQVLDAIISYPGELVVVVENKVGDAADWQAGNINITGIAVKLSEGQKPVPIMWPDLLADFNNVLERQLVGGAEAALLSDFLVFVEDHFAGLGPYQTLRLCARNEFRVARRLRALLTEALDTEARIDSWGPCCDIPDLGGTGTRAYLIAAPNMTEIAFSIYPADTLTQAWQFYARPNAVAVIRGLAQEEGWRVGHNFHFGHMQAGYAWTSGDIDPDSYLDLWVKEINDASSIEREEWSEYFDWLVEKRIAVPADREEFNRCFTNTKRKKATPRPGLGVARHWPMNEADDLDAIGKLAGQIKEAFATIVHRLSV